MITLEQLKTELREFIEQAKDIEQGVWSTSPTSYRVCWTDGTNIKYVAEMMSQTSHERDRDAAFIARSRNISPAMAECLLVTLDGLHSIQPVDLSPCNGGSCCVATDADDIVSENYYVIVNIITKIRTIWEAAKNG